MSSNNNNNNKSSSLPSNPNSRNSEINPMRRSFTGNPFSKPSLVANPRSNFSHTPANSPSDFSRRSFVDDKENAKDQTSKPAKVRSPAGTSKTGKNFMSPTISASFKMAESPRKKILTERNDAIPFSDPKTHVRKVTFADPLEQKMLDASFDGDSIPFPSFEDSSDDLSGEKLCDANVVPLIPMEDLSFETKHVNVPLIPKNDATDLSFESVHVPLIPENDIHIESPFENVSQEHDFVNLDPTFKLSPAPTPPISSTAAILDHVDADPSLPPYDPKTNYLSPRPQFLHYKPKPRMALCSNRELEDSFMSASFSDTEVTEDTQSDDSLKEPEDVSSEETVMQEEEQISEPSPVRAQLPENMVEEKELRKPSFSVKSKAFALILLMLAAFASISITNSPGIDYALFEDYYEAYKLSEFSEFARANIDQFSHFAKENLDVLARNLHTWFTKSLSSLSELMSDVRGAPHFAKLKYFNLTVLHGYPVVDQCPIFGRGENEISGTHLTVQESYTASELADEYLDDISAEHHEIYEEQFQQDMGMATGFENAMDAPAESEEVQKGNPATIIESEEQILQLDEAENLDAKLAQEIDSSFDVEDASQEIVSSFDVEDASESEEALEGQSATLVDPEQALQLVEAEEILTPRIDDSESKPSSNLEAAEIHNEMCGEENVDTNIAQENYANLNSKESDIDPKQSPGSDSEVAEIGMDDKASTDAAIRGSDQLLEAVNIPPHMVLCLLLCAGTVFIAGVTFKWSRKVKSRSKNITSSVKQPKIGSENKQISPDKPSLRNGPVELDVVGESCPSEMSSYQKSSPDNIEKTVNQSNEAISVEKKPRNNHRRESLASSSDYSMGSPSYGSLTVYEKILKGRGEEEIVTPVRRSSRIRSLATSPV